MTIVYSTVVSAIHGSNITVPYAKIGYLDNSKINVNLFCYFKICELFSNFMFIFHFIDHDIKAFDITTTPDIIS